MGKGTISNITNYIDILISGSIIYGIMSKERTARTTERSGNLHMGTSGIRVAPEVKFIAPVHSYVSRVEEQKNKKTGEIFTMQAGGSGDDSNAVTLEIIKAAIQAGALGAGSPEDVANYLRDIADFPFPPRLANIDSDLLRNVADKLTPSKDEGTS